MFFMACSSSVALNRTTGEEIYKQDVQHVTVADF